MASVFTVTHRLFAPGRALIALYSALLLFLSPAAGFTQDIAGTALIVGNGPERYAIEALAKQFETLHPRTSIDFFWHQNARPVEEVRKGEADIAITGQAEPDLPSTTVAWDGIAVVINFANPLDGLTQAELAKIFTGQVTFWSQVYEDGPEARISLVQRTWNQNIRQPFEKLLGITSRANVRARIVEKETDVFKAVNGDTYAIAYVSMAPALQALKDGYGVTLLFIDDIEPEYQTVLDATYPLRRPVVFVLNPDASPVARDFLAYVISPEGQRAIQTGASGLFQDKTRTIVHYYPLKPLNGQ
ncbi:MAG: substrate-binding domain-containing protein [Nitrospira sp.]|nr:substrate-binding domain-containing protein [Nitrospira sp.]